MRASAQEHFRTDGRSRWVRWWWRTPCKPYINNKIECPLGVFSRFVSDVLLQRLPATVRREEVLHHSTYIIFIKSSLAKMLFSHRFVTPNHKSELCTLPRTPTPFKSAMEKYGPLRPLVRSSSRFFTELHAGLADHVVVTVTHPKPRSVLLLSAADSEPRGRHQRGHPEGRWQWPGGCPCHAPWKASQNYG